MHKLILFVLFSCIFSQAAEIQSGSFQENSYLQGESIYFNVQVKNTGSMTLSGLWLNVDISDPNSINVLEGLWQNLPTLEPNETYETGFDYIWTVSADATLGNYYAAIGLRDISNIYDIEYGIDNFNIIESEEPFPLYEGKIVFHSYSNYEAWDGKLFLYDFSEQLLTEISQGWDIDHTINAHFSPDGSKIVFMGAPAGNHNSSSWDIYLWDLFSDMPINLTANNGLRDEDPKFSPNGNEIVFKQNGDLKVMDLINDTIIHTTNNGYSIEESMPYFTSDSQYIIYARGAGISSDIYLINKDGMENQPLENITNIQEYYPIIRSNSTFLYTKWVSAGNHHDQIYLGYFSDTNAQSLSFNDESADDSDPFPVNSDYVLFSSNRSGGQGGWDLYLADINSSTTWSMDEFNINTSIHELGICYFNGASINGCTDSEACNYDETATADDGSCAYEYDCAGTCGGDAVVDECGVCGGDGSSCTLNDSNLPIVIIDTDDQEILDDPRIVAHMGIIDNGTGTNYINDPFNGYDGQISIEIRGSSSQYFPKKQYALETQDIDGENLNVSILGMPEENDWILHAPYSDKSLLRNYLAYELARNMGRYASRTRFCELVINGDYKGLYIFMEKIKRDNNRVDIPKLEPDETTGDDLTGGYILKVDKWGGENNDGWESASPLPEYDGTWYQYHYPEPDDIVYEQKDYINNYITDFELLVASESFNDPDTGYYDQVNIESFIDVSLMSEISKNVDAYRLSAYMYKDKDSEDGRLTMGPIWDYNLAFGNADYYAGGDPIGWQMDVDLGGDPYKIPFWWYRIWDDETFRIAFNQRWRELRQTVFSEQHIMNMIDSTIVVLADAQVRNFQRWPILEEYVWPNAYVGGSYENEIDYLTDWITARLDWMDEQTGLSIIGDINGDGTINVIDIVMTVDLILNNNYDSVADINEDGLLNVLDVVILIDWILNP